MNVITTATVKGHTVTWAINGRIYFSRELHDALRPDLQGQPYTAKTINEFEAVCRLLSTTQPGEPHP